ncbi:phage virion morphogenesis protein [Pseudomonas aeruginosa]|uniref:phage virion morphogenesis protein n=1 Tax=Pseudomonas aeruginosa TaxID=287 RepID=UPI000FC42DD5|nr:phage virion morphogenesis protein [Pseudomonas aeruginosa]RUI34553.1 phage virion morphogenesis protein [Pseudomonas aeruginosa]
MTNRIDIQLHDQALRQRLADLLRAVTDTLPVMRSIAAELLAETEFAFMDEGPGWPQLSPATVAAREAKGRGPHPILQVTNALARSITTRADRTQAQIGSNLVYAAIQQLGGQAGRRTGRVRIPARPYLPITPGGQLKPAARQAIVDVLLTALSQDR